MDSVKVTYVGASGRRRARGRTESYWFRPHVTLTIPALDIEAVTGNDPENWRVESPSPVPTLLGRDSLRQGWDAKTTPRRPRRRRAAATESAQPQTGAPVNEE